MGILYNLTDGADISLLVELHCIDILAGVSSLTLTNRLTTLKNQNILNSAKKIVVVLLLQHKSQPGKPFKFLVI
jgi:hypothetical protein